jgi:hypothetical protein
MLPNSPRSALLFRFLAPARRQAALALPLLGLAGSLACLPSPCTVCHSLIFKGASISPYLSTHPKPVELKQLPDGGLDYTWIFTRKDDVPQGAVPEAGPRGNPSTSGGKAEGVMAELLIRFLAWDGRDANATSPSPARTPQRLYLVQVRTDAKGIVQAYSCDSVQFSPGGGGWR